MSAVLSRQYLYLSIWTQEVIRLLFQIGWHREDMTKLANLCAEPQCQFLVDHRWFTDLKREPRLHSLWEQYHCKYHDLGDTEIQQCVDKKNISKIELKGQSIRNILSSYVSQKLQNIKMPVGHVTVVLDTLAMPHVLWHKSIEMFKADLEKDFPDLTSDRTKEYFTLTGFYFSSEREPHVQVDRSLQYSRIASELLKPRGYKMINALDVTAAFAFDSDGQVCPHLTASCFISIELMFMYFCHS